MSNENFLIIPCVSINSRMNGILPSIFYRFFVQKVSEGLVGLGDCSLVFLSVFSEQQIDSNEEVEKLAKNLNMDLDYLWEIIDYLLDEGIIVAMACNEHKTWDQEAMEIEREEEEIILGEAIDELNAKFSEES